MPQGRTAAHRRVVLVSGHDPTSARRAGFHWLADAYWRAGWEVVFVTTSLSWLSYAVRDHRLALGPRQRANRLEWLRDRFASYVWFTPWHPANLRLDPLNRLSMKWFAKYGELSMPGAQDIFGPAELVIVESTPGLLLTPRIAEIAPSARLVYRVSDDLRLLGSHPAVIAAEAELAGRFDLISTPSHYLFEQFRDYPRVRLQYHGVRKELFDEATADPYNEGAKHAVFIGMAFFDHEFLATVAPRTPDWEYHILGPIPGLPKNPNVIAHGELPYAQTVPYVKFADAGLHTLAGPPGVESFTDTLKVLQYTYCRLPIIAPQFLASQRPNLLLYQPGQPESMLAALTSAASFDPDAAGVDTAAIPTWDDLAAMIADPTDPAELAEPTDTATDAG